MAEKIAAGDILARKELSDLLGQHVAIRSQMRFLIERLNDLSVQSNQRIAPLTTLNEKIFLYRYLLDNFQEAIRCHNELYERIEMLYGGILNEEIIIEQKEIEEQLDNIVSVTHNAVYHRLQRHELNRYASDIIKGVNRICESIDMHIAKKERALKQP